ncbi:hypothetical protein COO60DRAFT_660734 [Scenedesmus sp. NREL 46B-D3]|nr:hypothetical protein COO60DRAFT_660734 [Scenedesmus sp. NREL 46B-D3]
MVAVPHVLNAQRVLCAACFCVYYISICIAATPTVLHRDTTPTSLCCCQRGAAWEGAAQQHFQHCVSCNSILWGLPSLRAPYTQTCRNYNPPLVWHKSGAPTMKG